MTYKSQAQFEHIKDSVVELYGLVMTADSLKGIPAVSVVIKGSNRGTFTNDQGVFEIPLLKGDVIVFSSIGYKSVIVQIPPDLKGNEYSMVQLMTDSAQYLPVSIIKPLPPETSLIVIL